MVAFQYFFCVDRHGPGCRHFSILCTWLTRVNGHTTCQYTLSHTFFIIIIIVVAFVVNVAVLTYFYSLSLQIRSVNSDLDGLRSNALMLDKCCGLNFQCILII